ncbi:CBS domain-containing protein [Lysobacter soyae]|jgi:CBS domain-containing protein|uniref:CBS domain-containing protein n=1 Tax=Lysobacter soyae TaxID=2764185 RepID=A0ABX8WQD0_9GAMM|nr:CBS domain-containing protein [Lysobacter sp. CJ11]QYR52342.1 CBS domain-containing protein [Lysobacter sp. CJ11]
MNVEDVMTKNPASCNVNSSLKDVAALMQQNDCGQIPVVDDQNKPVGVITDRDIAVRAVAKGVDVSNSTVKEFMSSPVNSICFNMPLKDAVCQMEAESVRRIPVVCEQGTLKGMLSLADLAKADKHEATAELVKKVSEAPAQK